MSRALLGQRMTNAILLVAMCGAASAQSVVPFSTALPIGGPGQTVRVTMTVTTAGQVASIAALTEGSANLDYTATGVTCASGATYGTGATCTVDVTLQPRFPGLRHGAVLLLRSDGTTLAASYLEGGGIGALSVLVSGEINTVAGDANWTYSGDGVLATQSSIFLPMGEVTDEAGNLYISDTNNNRIRRVDASTRLISTVAGGSAQGYTGDGGPGTAATLSNPTALAMDGAGTLYISDSGNSVIRALNTTSGVITTVAGVGGQPGFSGDGGSALSAHFSGITGLAFDTSHLLYVADTGNNVIRRIDLAVGTVTRFAGTGSASLTGNGGPAGSATFNGPQGINFGSDGRLYVADLNNNVVRRIAPGGTITTFAGGGAGLGDGGQATAAGLYQPAAVALDQAGNVYIADAGENRIRKVTALTGIIQTVAGNGLEQMTGDGKNADQAELYGPYSIFYDGHGNLFVGDMFHNRIREINGSLAAFTYDPLRVGRTSPSKLEGLENDGNADLHTSAPVLVNASLDPGTTTCALPGTMPLGTSCVLGVAFSPTTLGSPVTGSVTLGSDAANAPGVVTVAGDALSVDPTTVTLISTLNPSVQGSAVTFRAHVITQGTTLSGTVQFFDSSTSLGTSSVTASGASGDAQLTTSTLSQGLHSISAVYSGDATNGTSTSAPLSQFVKQPSTTTLLSSPDPSVEGGIVTLTAHVTATGVTPSGQITFTDNGTTLGTGVLDGTGTASFAIATLTIGQHPLVASYAGDTNNSPSISGTTVQVVLGQGSSTMLASSNTDVPLGTAVVFSVQVVGTGSATPTGTVVFKDGATALGTASLTGSAAASFSSAALTPGQHAITALYQGDVNYAGSASAPLNQTIERLQTAAVVTSSANPSPAGAVLTLTAAVSTAAGGVGGAINGTVTFLNGGGTIGTAAVLNGVATLRIATLPLGQNAIAAIYGGSTNYQGSNTPSLPVSVVQASSTTALTTSRTPSIVESSINLTATVTTNGGVPTGVVTFGDGGTALGQAHLDAQGVATLQVSSLIVGQHTLTASYAGDTLDIGSLSAPLGETVLLHPSTEVLTSSATSISGGQQVTLISVVQWTDPIVPTGSVTFLAGTTALGVATVDATGVATLTILPQPGLTNVHAVYGGDTVFAGSASQEIGITVGSPPQFKVNATPTAMIVTTLQHYTVQVTVASVKGFTDNLAFGCAGLPRAATCTFSADRMSLAANGALTVSVVVDTGAPLTAGPIARNEVPSSLSPGARLALCGMPFGAVLALLLRRRGARWSSVLLVLFALGTVGGLAGCSGLVINGTPPGVYPFQITAAAQGAGVVEAVDMTLTVTQ